MIYSPLSTSLRSKEAPLAPNAQPSADGQAMVNVIVNGLVGVQPSTGAADEKFAGFVAAQTSAAPFLQTTKVNVETFVIPSSKLVTLGRAPIASTTLVRDDVTGLTLVADSVTGKVVDLTAAGVPGTSVTVTYRYLLTVVESRSLIGDVVPGGYAGLTTGSVSLTQSGTIYTDQFDSSLNWALPGDEVVLGANGQLSLLSANATGTVLRCSITSLPNVDYPFLGIDFDSF